MTRRSWQMSCTDGVTTLARQMPVRFDIVAETTLPQAPHGVVAHQIRQDIWRALQAVRGFSPVISVRDEGELIRIRAGGRLAVPVTDALRGRIQDVLDNPANRRRWLIHARRREAARLKKAEGR